VQFRHWIDQKKPVADADGDGLTFTLSPNGTASWALRYSRGARRREPTLGNYPDITLAAARNASRTTTAKILLPTRGPKRHARLRHRPSASSSTKM
jgi:hypothetical protein